MTRTRLGAIDTGSNAIRLVIAELAGANRSELVRVEAERIPVRLGHRAFTHGALDEATIDAAVRAFIHFRGRFDHNQVGKYRAVATSAVRSASNRDVLLHRVFHEAGIELEVIDGDEEARLVRKAVTHSVAASVPPRAILDLGGGSLEVNLHSDGSWRGVSLPVGTVRLMETFGLNGALGEAEAAMVRRYTATLMHPFSQTTSADGIEVAAITGGNAEALAKLFSPNDESPSFELTSLEKELPAIVGATVDERMVRFGVKRDRAEVMGIAALVFATVARQLGLHRLLAPGVGVREGVMIELAETAREEHVKAEGAHSKALLTAARGFANRVDHDTTHGEHVRVLARQLFHQLRDVHRIPDDKGVLLEVAALLHDVGEVVNQRGHHKHSEYMIRWGRIPGLDDAARELVAVMARTHRKDAARAREIINSTSLPKDTRGQLRKLTALLRLADGLDFEHRSRVEQVVCTRMGNAIVLDLVVRDGPSRSDAAMLNKADLLQEELGLQVRLTVARPVTMAVSPSEAKPVQPN